MGQYQETGEAVAIAMRLERYVEALLGCRKKEAKSGTEQTCLCITPQGTVSIVREGNKVSLICTAADEHMEVRLHEQKESLKPILEKRHVYMDGLEYGGVRYSFPGLIKRYGGKDVQTVRIDDTLYVFNMSGALIMHIQCRE